MIANLQAHYGFTRMPFGTAIPIDALYASAAHKEAVARLRWLISARGLGALTGIDYIKLLTDADHADTAIRLNLAHLAEDPPGGQNGPDDQRAQRSGG